MRVAQGLFAHTRWRQLEQWRVRWKVGAAVALPLAAAMLFGGLRLTLYFNDYSEYNSAADRISDIPAIIALESAASTVAGGQVFGITTDQDLVELSTAITQASVRAGRDGIDPSVAESLRQMTSTSEAIRSGGKGGADPARAAALNNAVVDDAVDTVGTLLTPIGIGSVVTAKTQLFEVLLAKVEGFHWLMAAMSAIQQPNRAETFHNAQGAFVSTVNTVERVMPSAKPTLDRVVRPNNVVLEDMIDTAIRTQDVNLLELRRLVLETRDVLAGLISQIVRSIINAVDDEVVAARSAALKASVVVIGTLVAALVLALLVARSLVRPLRRLRAGAAELAERHLPHEVERITRGAHLEDIQVHPVPVHTGEEIGEIARTVDGLHTQALKLAAQQQMLRDQVNDMFETMARRNQSLVDRQLSMIEALEFEEKDPDRLGQLFRLDHLAARMRRTSANLLVLAGTRSRHDRSGPVEVRDILRAAVSEVEDYQRVKTGATPNGWVAGIAATDVVHLIAEMLENALRASPPDSDVTFSYSRTSEGGLLIEVIDEGIGIVAAELREINERLATPAVVTVATTRQMGMFVVGRLAERHGITVRLRRTNDRALNPGITASLHIPSALVEAPSQDPDDPANRQPVIPIHRNVLGRTAKAKTGAAAGAAGTATAEAETSAAPLMPPKSHRNQPPLTAETPTPTPTSASASAPAPAPAPAGTSSQVGAVPATPVITSYGLPKRVPGVNKRGRRKAGSTATTTPAATTSATSASDGAHQSAAATGSTSLSSTAPSSPQSTVPGSTQQPSAPASTPQPSTPGSTHQPSAPGSTQSSSSSAGVTPIESASAASSPKTEDSADAATGVPTSTTDQPAAAQSSSVAEESAQNGPESTASTRAAAPRPGSATPTQDDATQDPKTPNAEPAGSVRRASKPPAPRTVSAGDSNSAPPTGPLERVVKTASFFHSVPPRTESATAPKPRSGQAESTTEPVQSAAGATPIFAGMASAWLSDPDTGEVPVPTSWDSPADAGWSAAQRAAEQPVTTRTVSGLPKRDPGNQLVPGGTEPGPDAPEPEAGGRRDPETIRSGLNRYDRGVRDGRANGKLKPFAAEDVR